MKRYVITVSEFTDDQDSQLINMQKVPYGVGGKNQYGDRKISPDKLLLSPAEAAEMLGISRSKIYELVHVKGFPSFRLGRSIVISYDALREWIRKQVEIYNDDCL